MTRSAFSFARRSTVFGSLLIAAVATTAATVADTSTSRRAGGMIASSGSAAADAFRHTRLVRSIPGADSTVAASPATVQLWFSERIELGLSRVRIVGADGKSVAIAPLTQDATKAGTPVVGRVPAPLAPGRYTLHWTAASGDGHAVKGLFGFTITAR